jgi:hypothetical protein
VSSAAAVIERDGSGERLGDLVVAGDGVALGYDDPVAVDDDGYEPCAGGDGADGVDGEVDAGPAIDARVLVPAVLVGLLVDHHDHFRFPDRTCCAGDEIDECVGAEPVECVERIGGTFGWAG